MQDGAGDDLLYCPDCHRATAPVVLNHDTGDTICTECALVLDEYYVEESSDRRTFADDGVGPNRDPRRVGVATDPFLEGCMYTYVNHSTARTAQAKGGKAADYLRRFCSLLGMGDQEIRAAQDAVRRLQEGLDVGYSPQSIAATIIYMVVQRVDAKITAKHVSNVTGVAESTINKAQKDLAPHAKLLFP